MRPYRLEPRRLFARSAVRALALEEPTDPAIVFPTSRGRSFHPFANVAVKLGWMGTDTDDNFLPADPVTLRMVHRALVTAAGLGDLAACLTPASRLPRLVAAGAELGRRGIRRPRIERFRDIRAGDLTFYDGSGDGVVDHVNVYIGNGWALDTSDGAGG